MNPMTPKALSRDLLALPLTLLGVLCMFIAIPLFALAVIIGGNWTAKYILKIYGHDTKSTK